MYIFPPLTLFPAIRTLAGMSVARRVPLRAFANPAPVRQKVIANASLGLLAIPTSRPSPRCQAVTVPRWSLSNYSRPSLSSLSSRGFVTKSSPLLSAENKIKEPAAGHTSGANSSKPKSNKLKYWIALGVLGTIAVTVSDAANHAYQAARRSGRVVGALAVCINE